MSPRAPRFEIVRNDDGYHARFRASNGQVVWWTETYKRRASAARAVHILARGLSPTARIWFSNGTGGSELRFGHPADTYGTAHRIEVRNVDERGQ